jgi:hypothetical protein
MTTPLPHRFRESSFRRYETIIHDAVRAFPEPLKIRCALYDLSSITMSCRLRDAMKSFATHKWPVTWDASMLEKFHRIYQAGELRVHELSDAGFIVVGKSATIKTSQPLPTHQAITFSTQTKPKPITLTTTEQKNLLIHLAAERLLNNAIPCFGFTQQEIDYYMTNHDISFDAQADGSYLII